MKKIECEVIRDLLPLYVDQVCSEESRKLVDEHLLECSDCKSELKKIENEITIPKIIDENASSDDQVIQAISAFWTRSKVRSFIKGIIIATLSCAVLFFGYIGLFRWNIIPVSSDVAQISEVSQLVNGMIVFHLKLTDGYEVNYAKYKKDANGDFYVTAYRPIIKRKPIVDAGGLHNTFYVITQSNGWKVTWADKYDVKLDEVNALYYGTEKDRILIWDKDMDLPPASDKVEDEFN